MKLSRWRGIEELNAAVAELLVEHLRIPGRCAVMLSGGNTPIPAYKKVASSWGRLQSAKSATEAHIIFSDERMAPESSPESNYANALPMIKAIGAPPEHVIRVNTGLTTSEAADQYDTDLGRFVSGGGRITLGLLGMGTDGHTASLFSLADLERGCGRWAIAVHRVPGPDRVSVTPDLLGKVERIVFIVAGKEKSDLIERLIAQDMTMPAAVAVRQHPSVEVWMSWQR